MDHIPGNTSMPPAWWKEERPDFIHSDTKYKCVSCHQAAFCAMQTRCGHWICYACLQDLFKTTAPLCPGGEENCHILKINEVHPDFCVYREMLTWKVYCKHKDNGCQHVMAWSELDEHTSNCQYGGVDCPNKSAGCPIRVAQQNVKQHIRSCSYRREKCSRCNEAVIYNNLQSHVQDGCPETSVSCPHGCGQNLHRKLIDQHRNTCPNKPTNSKLTSLDCTFNGPSSPGDEYEQLATSMDTEKSLNQLNNVVLEMTRIKVQLQEITNLNKTLQTQVYQYKQENGKLFQEVENLKGECERNKAQNEILSNELVELSKSSAQKEELEEQRYILNLFQEDMASALNQGTTQQHMAARPYRGKPTFEKHQRLPAQMTGMDVPDGEGEVQEPSHHGQLIWKISNFRYRKQLAAASTTSRSMYSVPFFTSKFGYKLCARIYLNGDGVGKGAYVSLYLVIMRSEYDAVQKWPFREQVTFTLLDQVSGKQHHSDVFRTDPSSSSFQRPVSEMNIASGCPMFVSHSVIEREPYLVNDTVFIKIAVG